MESSAALLPYATYSSASTTTTTTEKEKCIAKVLKQVKKLNKKVLKATHNRNYETKGKGNNNILHKLLLISLTNFSFNFCY